MRIWTFNRPAGHDLIPSLAQMAGASKESATRSASSGNVGTAITNNPAARADATPVAESSSAIASDGSTPSRRQASA